MTQNFSSHIWNTIIIQSQFVPENNLSNSIWLTTRCWKCQCIVKNRIWILQKVSTLVYILGNYMKPDIEAHICNVNVSDPTSRWERQRQDNSQIVPGTDSLAKAVVDSKLTNKQGILKEVEEVEGHKLFLGFSFDLHMCPTACSYLFHIEHHTHTWMHIHLHTQTRVVWCL